jgi:hypothetical protein
VNAASNRVEHAREVGAEQYAPYEYYFAKEHLLQAQVEASEASYSDAAAYAETAEEYANKAIELARKRREAASSDVNVNVNVNVQQPSPEPQEQEPAK